MAFQRGSFLGFLARRARLRPLGVLVTLPCILGGVLFLRVLGAFLVVV